jgi:hypothetical protein
MSANTIAIQVKTIEGRDVWVSLEEIRNADICFTRHPTKWEVTCNSSTTAVEEMMYAAASKS